MRARIQQKHVYPPRGDCGCQPNSDASSELCAIGAKDDNNLVYSTTKARKRLFFDFVQFVPNSQQCTTCETQQKRSVCERRAATPVTVGSPGNFEMPAKHPHIMQGLASLDDATIRQENLLQCTVLPHIRLSGTKLLCRGQLPSGKHFVLCRGSTLGSGYVRGRHCWRSCLCTRRVFRFEQGPASRRLASQQIAFSSCMSPYSMRSPRHCEHLAYKPKCLGCEPQCSKLALQAAQWSQ